MKTEDIMEFIITDSWTFEKLTVGTAVLLFKVLKVDIVPEKPKMTVAGYGRRHGG